MSETIPAVSEETISAWVGSRSFQLGRSYFENGAVFDPRRQGSALKAFCQGSMPQPYRLRVAFGAAGIEEADCSCPVGDGGHCKHVGALLLTWLDQPDAFRVVVELDTDLEQRSREELIALIKQMLQLQPDLETLLEVALPGGDRRRSLVNPEIYRRQVSSAFRRGGDDWMASSRIATDIGSTVSIGDGFLALDDYASANIVYQEVAQGILAHYEMINDEDGGLGEVVGWGAAWPVGVTTLRPGKAPCKPSLTYTALMWTLEGLAWEKLRRTLCWTRHQRREARHCRLGPGRYAQGQ